MIEKNSVQNSNKKTEKTYQIPVYLSNIGGRIIVDRYVEVANPHNIFEAKQSLWDWWKQYSKEKPHNYSSACLNYNEGWIEISYQDGSKFRLHKDQFLNRNLIPCYEKVKGQFLIHHYEEGADSLPPLSSFHNEMTPLNSSNLMGGLKA